LNFWKWKRVLLVVVSRSSSSCLSSIQLDRLLQSVQGIDKLQLYLHSSIPTSRAPKQRLTRWCGLQIIRRSANSLALSSTVSTWHCCECSSKSATFSCPLSRNGTENGERRTENGERSTEHGARSTEHGASRKPTLVTKI
jgi:hypothetical protein